MPWVPRIAISSSNDIATILKTRAFNRWSLFVLISLPVSIAVISVMNLTDMNTANGVSAMIQFTVRCSVPFLYIAFIASATHALYPSHLSQWLLRNRAIFGLCFAASMAWQLLFILWLVGIHTEYYIGSVYVLRDAIEGMLGYVLLTFMTLTSFKTTRRKISPKHWKWLHKTGIYYLWAYAWSVYWYELYYYKDPELIDYLYYWLGLAALCLRITAWYSKQRASIPSPVIAGPTAFIAGTIIIAGLAAASTGSSWSSPAHTLLLGNTPLQLFELYLPYYPFVPFLPVFAIASGTWLLTRQELTPDTEFQD
ncbi:MAG: hypothetical protein HOJ61_09060 [Gammaproteobacteria bacterium]|nr:hypothetical protein [Gammaproteobacteria bacterium]MBT6246302.1 hypothetical protein [Gammaproteobacteria bacterium]